MMIRFFAEVSPTSPATKHALVYAGKISDMIRALNEERMAAADPYRGAVAEKLSMRIVASEALSLFGALHSRNAPVSPWSMPTKDRPHGFVPYFQTPIETSFVSVVCTEPSRWPKFWTKGCRNVLIAPPPYQEEGQRFFDNPPTVGTSANRTAAKYNAIIGDADFGLELLRIFVLGPQEPTGAGAP